MAGVERSLGVAWIGALILTVLFAVPVGRGLAADPQDPGAGQPMRLQAFASSADPQQLLKGDVAAWEGVAEQPLLLSRTPPLYEGDPEDDGARPGATVGCVRTPQVTLVRLRWSDATESRPSAPELVPDGGDPGVYKQHSLDIERFADAACVMVPAKPPVGAALPSLMMGEAGVPVELYYWHGVRGFQRLQAAGRGTTQSTGQTFPGSARRTASGWEVVFELPASAATMPMAFAVWDGHREHRDGLKWFSPWYEVAP